MINKIILVIAAFLLSTSISSAAPEDIEGTFAGEETVTVYGCPFASVQKKKTLTTYTDVVEDTFKGHGSNDDGKFTLQGKFIEENKVTIELKGKNSLGQNWTATSAGELNGDGYTYSLEGKVLAHPYCKFKSEGWKKRK